MPRKGRPTKKDEELSPSGRKLRENAMQIELVRLMNLLVKPNIVWFHVANQRNSKPYHGALLKRMGVKAGVPDLVFIAPGGLVYFMELKVKGSYASPEQKAFLESLKLLGCRGEIVYSVDEALLLLKMWGLLRTIHDVKAA